MSAMDLLWPALAAFALGLWSYGHKKRMTWTALALLLFPVLVIVLGVLILGAFGLAWRAVVWRYCGLCFVAGGNMVVFVWTAVWLWREVAAGRWHPVAVWLCKGVSAAVLGVACVLSTMFSSFVVYWMADLDHTEERDGQRVVTQYVWMDGCNYYAYHGPLVRGIDLLAGSWDLHIQAVEEEEEQVREKISEELGLSLPHSFVTARNEDTHSGFHNDGETCIELWFNINITPKIEADPDWVPLPLPEELTALTELTGEPRIPAVENGYYWFQDRQSADSRDYSGTLERKSYNFTLAVYDTDTKRLYCWVLDTE